MDVDNHDGMPTEFEVVRDGVKMVLPRDDLTLSEMEAFAEKWRREGEAMKAHAEMMGDVLIRAEEIRQQTGCSDDAAWEKAVREYEDSKVVQFSR